MQIFQSHSDHRGAYCCKNITIQIASIFSYFGEVSRTQAARIELLWFMFALSPTPKTGCFRRLWRKALEHLKTWSTIAARSGRPPEEQPSYYSTICPFTAQFVGAGVLHKFGVDLFIFFVWLSSSRRGLKLWSTSFELMIYIFNDLHGWNIWLISCGKHLFLRETSVFLKKFLDGLNLWSTCFSDGLNLWSTLQETGNKIVFSQNMV